MSLSKLTIPMCDMTLAKVLIDRRTIPESLATKDNENDPVVVAAKNYVDAKGRAAYYRNKSEQAYNSKSKISDRDLAALQASAASIVASEALETRAVRLRAEIAQRERTMNLIRQEN